MVHHLIPFGDHIIKRQLKVGESGAVHGDHLLEALWTVYIRLARYMVDVVAGYKLVRCRQVPLVKYLLCNTA